MPETEALYECVEQNEWSDMGKARTRAGAGKAALTAAQQRQAADFLAGAHARMQLWRACKRKACRRRQSCRGNVDECGLRCAPKAWEWVHHLVAAIRDGSSRRAAVRAADRKVRGERGTLVFNFGYGPEDREVIEFVKNDDGTWSRVDASAPPAEWELQLRRLTAAGAPWLRGAPRLGAEA
jgi:hypothetical protein